MSLESEDQCIAASMGESKDESRKRSKISYTRDFLLSFCESNICKRLPAGFDASILSEFEDASHSIPERQRIPGGLSLQKYGSTLVNRVDSSSNYSRGSHGRWDTRSSGSNDRDGDSLSDWDSTTQDSGKRYGNHSRRTWQNPEHDGLLGSGAFPRPSGYTGGASAPRVRGNDHYQLNRTSEPYHPPRFLKALPHSRQDATDSRDDETFGSAECSSEDRAEEERKRRASFELMRKEQQKTLQEKQKHPDKHKEKLDTDITVLLENPEENFWSKSDDRLEDRVHVASVSQGDSVKCSFSAQAAASRPLVPPGFGSAVSEKSLGAKSSVPSPAPEVGNIEFEDNAHTKSNGSDNDRESDKQSASRTHSHEQICETRNVGVPFMDTIEKTLVPSSGAEASNYSFSFENPSYKSSSLLEPREGWVDSAVANFDAEKVTRFEVGTVDQDQSASILEKLFNNALPANSVGSPSFVEHNDVKSDGDTWNAQPSHASKFAHWFLEEEKKPVDDVSSSKARDLLSLIVNRDNGGSQVSTVSDEQAIENIPRIFPFESTEVVQKLITSAAATSAAVAILEPFYHSDKPDACSGVLTCEDLEQSILAEVKDSGPSVQHPTQGSWNFLEAKVEPQKTDVDDHASQHLLSLLQKGIVSKGSTTSTLNLDMGSSDKLGVPDSVIGIAENVHDNEKTLTLETLFGTAFMKELQSLKAPVSVHRSSINGSARTDVLEPHGLPFSIGDDGFFRSTVSEHVSNKPSLIQVPQPDKDEGNWLSFDYPQSKGSKLEADGGYKGRADEALDIRLPEEESLIAVGDPMHHETSQFMPVGGASRTKEFVSSEPPVDIVEKLAALNAILKDERSTQPGLERLPVLHGPYEPLESEVLYQHLHGRTPPPQFPPHQMNHARPPFHSLDQHAVRNPPMKFIGPEGIHQDPHHAFPPNIVHRPFHGLGGPRFDPAHHSALHMPMPGNFPPPHLLHGLPRGVPLPHPFNHMPGYIPELNPNQGFPLNHQQANYSGLGMGIQGSVGGGNHTQALERLIEMELRGNQKQTPPVAAGHGPGIYGPELDMAFRYR